MRYINGYEVFNSIKESKNKNTTEDMVVTDFETTDETPTESPGNIISITVDGGTKLIPGEDSGGEFTSLYIDGSLKIGDIISFKYDKRIGIPSIEYDELWGVSSIIINGVECEASVDSEGGNDAYLSLTTDIKTKFESFINWDLLEDAKDMSLEYLDDGYTLVITINYRVMNKHTMPISETYHKLYTLRYNHSSSAGKWHSYLPFKLDDVDVDKISYHIDLENRVYSRGFDKNKHEYNKNIIERLKLAYKDISDNIMW